MRAERPYWIGPASEFLLFFLPSFICCLFSLHAYIEDNVHFKCEGKGLENKKYVVFCIVCFSIVCILYLFSVSVAILVCFLYLFSIFNSCLLFLSIFVVVSIFCFAIFVLFYYFTIFTVKKRFSSCFYCYDVFDDFGTFSCFS